MANTASNQLQKQDLCFCFQFVCITSQNVDLFENRFKRQQQQTTQTETTNRPVNLPKKTSNVMVSIACDIHVCLLLKPDNLPFVRVRASGSSLGILLSHYLLKVSAGWWISGE